MAVDSFHQRARALIRADCSEGCWEVREVGGGRGREMERREKIHVMVNGKNRLKLTVSFSCDIQITCQLVALSIKCFLKNVCLNFK